MQTIYQNIKAKVLQKERLSRQDGLALLGCNDLTWLGHLADTARQLASGDAVYFSINRYISLTNICVAKCKCCATSCDETSPEAFFITKEKVLDIARQASRADDLSELHIGSALHPHWGLGYYSDIIQSIKTALPDIHLKAFSTAEIYHFAQITAQPVETVLKTLQQAGLGSLLGDNTEILSNRVRGNLCQHKAGADQWLDIVRTAHRLSIPSYATMLYGHVETKEERLDHLLSLRSLQDETGGFQTFIPIPFQPQNTRLDQLVDQTSAWEDLKTVAISRLMLDNFKYIKADLGLLTLPVGQLALGFGANDLDSTISERKTSHAPAKSEQYLNKEILIKFIRQTGRTPVKRDPLYNVVQTY